MILSGADLPNDRPRRRPGGEPVTLIGRPTATRTPARSAEDMLAELLRRQAAAEELATERHEAVMARLAALDKAVAEVDDTAGSAGSDVDRLRREVSTRFEDVRSWLTEILDVVDPLEDEDE